MDQASPLCFCVLQAVKNWTVGRPGNEARISPQLPQGKILALEPAKWECTSASDFSFSRTENTGMIAGLGKVRKIKSCDIRSCDGHGIYSHGAIMGQS